MKHLPIHPKWFVPLFFIVLGIFLLNFTHGHSFLGLICFGISGAVTIYFLFHRLENRWPSGIRWTRRIFIMLLCLGLAVYGITELFILSASWGNPDISCDYIVVLGAKVNGTSPSLTLSERIDAAYDYLTAHPDSIAILSGGQGSDEGISEAECMFRELTAKGIPRDRLWLEDKATSTWENLQFSLELIQEKTGHSPTKLGIVSSEFHLFRAGLFAQACGIEAVGIPARTGWLSIRINYYLREAAGVWHYLILGG